MSGTKLRVDSLRNTALDKFTGTQELRRHLTVSKVILSLIEILPFTPSL
jgi:hypothetical protein